IRRPPPQSTPFPYTTLFRSGFPYDVHAYAEVAPKLAKAGCRVYVPYLRGYGQTRFLSDTTPRSGEQAALGADLLALMDALDVPRSEEHTSELQSRENLVCRL